MTDCKQCEQLKAERDRLREELAFIATVCTGENQVDVFGDTEALLWVAKRLGAYNTPPKYSPEALKQD